MPQFILTKIAKKSANCYCFKQKLKSPLGKEG